MRPDRDRNYVSWLVFLRGTWRRHRACTLCGSHRVSRSHTPFGALGQVLRLAAMRCHACGRRFSLRDAVAGSARHASSSARHARAEPGHRPPSS